MENKNSNPTRLIKVVSINPYLNNMAGFNWTVYFTSIIFVATTIFSSLLFVIYFMESLDYLKALSEVENSLIVIMKYFATNVMGFLNNFNHLNDLIGQKVFNFNIPLLNPNISAQGWLLITASSILAGILHIMSLYQFYAQKIIKNSGFFNYYIPYLLLHKFYNRKKLKKLYMRVLPLVKVEKINKTDFNLLIQNFFEVPVEEVENYEIKIESKRLYFWFDYQILHLMPIEKKGKKENDTKEEIPKDKPTNRQDTKVSSNSKKPKKLFA
jgi:hypothetical protein